MRRGTRDHLRRAYPMTNPRYASSSLLPSGLVFSDTPSRLVAFLLDGLVLGPANGVIFALLGFDYSRFGPAYCRIGTFGWRARSSHSRSICLFRVVLERWPSGHAWAARAWDPGRERVRWQIADGCPAFNRYLGMGNGWDFSACCPTSRSPCLLLSLLCVVPRPDDLGRDEPDQAGPARSICRISAVVRPAGAGNGWALGVSAYWFS